MEARAELVTVHKPLGEPISRDRNRLTFKERVEGKNLIEGELLGLNREKPTSIVQRNPRAVETAKAGKAKSPGSRLERGTGSQIPQRETEGQERVPADARMKPSNVRGARQPGAKLRG